MSWHLRKLGYACATFIEGTGDGSDLNYYRLDEKTTKGGWEAIYDICWARYISTVLSSNLTSSSLLKVYDQQCAPPG